MGNTIAIEDVKETISNTDLISNEEIKKMTPSDRFIILQEVCAMCLQNNINEISIEDANGNLQIPDIPAFCKSHQKGETCQCLKLFVRFLKGKKLKEFNFCTRCCLSHDVEMAPAFMFQEARGNDKDVICPLIPKAFANNEERVENCQQRVLRVAEGLD